MVAAPPSLFVIVMVLCAALLHAIWNALIKRSHDQVLTMGLLNIGHGLVGLALVLACLPPLTEAWPFLIASTLVHLFYYSFLLAAYRFGDLSEVYPIARGIAPVLVAIGGYYFADEYLPLGAWIGVLLVSAGIGVLFFGRKKTKGNGKAILAALITGVTIAVYSVIDGMGVRAAQSAGGYIGWLFLLEAFAALIFVLYSKSSIRQMSIKFACIGLVGGLISALAYGLAIYAFSLTTFASVSAIRESSVIMAALIGVIWFGERPWKLRVIAAMIVASGVFTLAMSG